MVEKGKLAVWGGGCNCTSHPCSHDGEGAFSMRVAASKKRKQPAKADEKAKREAAKRQARMNRQS